MKIGIDPGHGGIDPGAMANGLSEAELNLTIAQALRAFAEAAGHVVTMTHDGMAIPKKLSLTERCKIVTGCDLMVSIHCNSGPPPNTATGHEVYRAAGSQRGLALATAISKRLARVMPPRRDPVRIGDFTVLTKSRPPAALVECGFLTNRGDAHILVNSGRAIAKAIFDGVEDWKNGETKISGNV